MLFNNEGTDLCWSHVPSYYLQFLLELVFCKTSVGKQKSNYARLLSEPKKLSTCQEKSLYRWGMDSKTCILRCFLSKKDGKQEIITKVNNSLRAKPDPWTWQEWHSPSSRSSVSLFTVCVGMPTCLIPILVSFECVLQRCCLQEVPASCFQCQRKRDLRR